MQMSAGEQLAKVVHYYGLSNCCCGATEKIICPFHHDKNPSLIIDYERGFWFCFGCNLSGDARKFVQNVESGLNDLQSYRKFLQILKTDKTKKITVGRYEKKKQNHELYAEAYDHYHGLSKINWSALGSEEREILEARDYMFNRGFDAKTLTKCGAKYTYERAYSLIFPIMDNGKFRGWVCRTTRKDIEAKRKYLYNTGFSRAETVVGNYGKKPFVIVVEGYMDRLKFIQYGVENVVAIFGWKMSDGQFRKLKAAGITTIISALDNDECGKKGTEYLRKIWGSENVIRFKYLKGIKDIGETNVHQFKKMYEKTMSIFGGK